MSLKSGIIELASEPTVAFTSKVTQAIAVPAKPSGKCRQKMGFIHCSGIQLASISNSPTFFLVLRRLSYTLGIHSLEKFWTRVH